MKVFTARRGIGDANEVCGCLQQFNMLFPPRVCPTFRNDRVSEPRGSLSHRRFNYNRQRHIPTCHRFPQVSHCLNTSNTIKSFNETRETECAETTIVDLQRSYQLQAEERLLLIGISRTGNSAWMFKVAHILQHRKIRFSKMMPQKGLASKTFPVSVISQIGI